MSFPVVTQELALRIGQSEADHIVSWLRVLQAYAGNPFGVEIRQFGNAVALSNKAMSLGPLFNRVLGLDETEWEAQEEILRFYREKGIGCRIDINPYQATAGLLRSMGAAGLIPFRFHDFLYAVPSELKMVGQMSAPPDIEVRRVRREELPLWTDSWRAGFTEVLGVDDSLLPLLADATAHLYDTPGWSLYLALVNGVPAATGALYIQNGIASIAIAGTRPEFRRRGCQTALLQARLDDAVGQDCDLVVAQAALDAISHHNMERAGLRIAYTRAFWLQQRSE
jgi:GNAT superfamily N-acetyltransferase